MATKRTLKRFIILSITMILLASTWTAKSTQAAAPKLDHIRVALFLQLPSKNYTATTPAATFSSKGGLQVGTRLPDGVSSWFNTGASSQIRFAVDDYKVKLFETSNFGSALAVFKRVQAAKGSAYLNSVSKNKSIIYQVFEGTYMTAAEASAAQQKWAADNELSKLIGSHKSTLQGPLHLESGTYASKAAAVTAANAFGAAGLDAYVAVRLPQEGSMSYSVMVGSAVSDAELQIVKSAAAKASGGESLKNADSKSPYMLLKNDHSVSAKAESSIELYSFGGGDVKVSVAPAGQEPIQLTERSNRTYRGSFELSVLNGRMAVVNELPFEQYLYSVVGVEMYPSWPSEALKAQAVAARTYALYKGFGFQIAHVVDTTLSQAYYGTGSERASTIAAVDETAGEVALYNGKLIEALFSSNSGGMTADAKEIWNNAVPYLQPVSSPDHSSEEGIYHWYRVVLQSGEIGYIREDLIDQTSRKSTAGSSIMVVNTDGTKVRKHPIIQDTIPLIAQVNRGNEVIALEKTVESNSMSWIRGPYTGEEMLTAINARALKKLTDPVSSLQVSERGASGRAVEIAANGQRIEVKNPDSLRGTLGVQGSLPSTLFEIEETAKVAIIGADNAKASKPANNAPVFTISAGGKVAEAADADLFILDGEGNVRAATKEPSFRFIGTGNGHGLGLSQYGALSLARQGYDYQYILKYYYKDVIIAKE
ncbi:SpoIID/LytB domain-containing protein [Paenibacillus alkaliterrae]|uniref:SpoIID/LytB domain-containing protein n=1 Tax=Paenibacillus alkaliterrae TaxID=320909 RepID=UPI001F39BF47|nr:SpoIID/LytB domain-containing protein [Paenibacillus alkaliterrae]MCF2937278.1 SpoIID/LytB domain-containing protein [Paenibacillus alkaliterrae]